MALDGFWTAPELGGLLQRLADEFHGGTGDWDFLGATPRLLRVLSRCVRAERCVRHHETQGAVSRTTIRWPIDLDSLAEHYPSVGDILRHVEELRVTVLLDDDDDDDEGGGGGDEVFTRVRRADLPNRGDAGIFRGDRVAATPG